MDAADQLRVLESTGGDSALLALASVDLTFPDLPLDNRAALRTALEAAAVRHWCDGTILAELVDVPQSQGHDQWSRLKALPVVESFPARGKDAGNVHEASRLAIRRRLRETEQTRFRHLSASSADLFERDTRSVGRIEWIFHLLVADTERGADVLEQLSRAWSGSARHEDFAALAAALAELEDSQLLEGRALVRARLVIAERRADVEGAAHLGDQVNTLLKQAEAANDLRLIGDVNCLIGDVAQALGDLTGAERAFGQYLTISERLAAREPANTGWQRDLAVAHGRIGDLAQARGDLAGAEQAFAQDLAICKRLAAGDPRNTDWQRELAVAYNAVGDLALARGDLALAEQAFDQSLAISEWLTEQDPTNTSWQRELADAHNAVGDLAPGPR